MVLQCGRVQSIAEVECVEVLRNVRVLGVPWRVSLGVGGGRLLRLRRCRFAFKLRAASPMWAPRPSAVGYACPLLGFHL